MTPPVLIDETVLNLAFLELVHHVVESLVMLQLHHHAIVDTVLYELIDGRTHPLRLVHSSIFVMCRGEDQLLQVMTLRVFLLIVIPV